MSDGYKCSRCGEVHKGLPLSFGADAPVYYSLIPENERTERVSLTSDECIIDNRYYFVRGCLDVPIHERSEVFSWGVWVSLSEKNFRLLYRSGEALGIKNTDSYVGWLSTLLPGYPDTTKLKACVHLRTGQLRPYIEVEPSEHALAVEQRDGISLGRAREIGENLLHGPAR